MRNINTLIFLLLSILLKAQPVALHPDNPHYLIYHGKPLIIISSGEHYGAVMNLDFDNIKYLNTLEKDGMNYTRIFSGFYMESPGQFGIKNNSLAPKPLRLTIPWARSNTDGYKNGGNKFDLDRWDPEYFARLKTFIQEAGKRNVIVELVLFTSIYNYENWEIHPFHPENNINHLTLTDFRKVNTLTDLKLFSYQEKMVRKIVDELNAYDNLIYEIQNEPWADNGITALDINTYDNESGKEWVRHVDIARDSSLMWQQKIGRIIHEEELKLPGKHLIAQNYSNFKYPLSHIEPEISILNFHYVDPENIQMNYGFNRVISFDESGFSGSESGTYLKQAWNFILAGGGIFNNLDYSFYPGFEDGTGQNEAPGGGDIILRTKLKILKNFMEGFNFIRLKPDMNVILHAPGLFAKILAWKGNEYAFYFEGKGNSELSLSLPDGNYSARWYNIDTGEVINSFIIKSQGDKTILKTPDFKEAVALKLIIK
jgi:hypothetical protein